MQAYTEWLQGDSVEKKGLSLRYIGSLVADFHRNLITGGVFYYPADNKDPKKPGGKLRLLYEAGPLGFLAEQAGGYATDGRQAILGSSRPSCTSGCRSLSATGRWWRRQRPSSAIWMVCSG